jgi:hypothetical protein
VILRYRGLAFARWDDGTIFFGCNDMREELTPASRAAFERMMQDLGIYRHTLASDTRHPLYRGQAERWLESLVRNDVTRVDSVLDSRFVYAQVFAGSGAEHGIIDVLTITRAGRLAILELKASEQSIFPCRPGITGYGCAAIWSLASFAATVIFQASKFKKRLHWFIWLLPRCVFIR